MAKKVPFSQRRRCLIRPAKPVTGSASATASLMYSRLGVGREWGARGQGKSRERVAGQEQQVAQRDEERLHGCCHMDVAPAATWRLPHPAPLHHQPSPPRGTH